MTNKITPNFIKEVHDAADILISESELMHAFDEAAVKITADLSDRNPIFLCCMNGGLLTTSELVKRLTFPLQIDYVHASRYKNEYTGGALHWLTTPNLPFEDRTIILVDDILDGGITLSEIKAFYEKRGAKEVLSFVMLNKLAPRDDGGLNEADYVGLDIENRYVYGFGLDYHGYLRNVPAIYAVAEKHMI